MSESESRILIVDDDERLLRLLTRYLERAQYLVKSTNIGNRIDLLVDDFEPHLVLLDLTLPGASGFDIARSLRNKDPHVGIIIITGNTESVDKVVGLELGADDYIQKPLDQRELLARTRSVLRRVKLEKKPAAKVEDGSKSQLECGDLTLDPDSLEAKSTRGDVLPLTTSEFRLLTLFARRRNQVLSRDVIIDHVSGRERNPFDRSVDVLVGKLRKKLQSSKVGVKIVTIRNAGYKCVTTSS